MQALYEYSDLVRPPKLGKKRAGYTTNKGNPRSKRRARMARVSRRRNR